MRFRWCAIIRKPGRTNELHTYHADTQTKRETDRRGGETQGKGNKLPGPLKKKKKL